MKSPLLCLISGLALLPTLQAGSSLTDGKSSGPVTITEQAWGGTLVGAGIKSNGEFTEGSFFLTQPLIDTLGKGSTMGGSLLFLEPYITWGAEGEAGVSLGLGFRHLFSEQTVEDARMNQNPGLLTEGIFIGGSFFVDYEHSAQGSDFWQLGVGAEAGTRYVEVHLNYYFPQSEGHTLSRETQVFTNSSSRRSTQTTSSGPFVAANGNTVQNFTRRSFETTRTVTTRRTIETFEEPMDGWDTELSVLIPKIDKWCEVRLIGGYYDYQGDRSHASDFAGWRGGVEVRPLKGLVLSATWFEKSQLYNDHWLVGLRLEVPLGRSKETFSSGYRHLVDHLYEPVHRKNTPITNSPVQSVGVTNSSSNQSTGLVGQTTSQKILSKPQSGGEQEIPQDNDDDD